MMTRRIPGRLAGLATAALVALLPHPAGAQTASPAPDAPAEMSSAAGTDSAAADSAGPRLSVLSGGLSPAALTASADTGRPRAVEYSDAYGTRLAIHRVASYTELPLFATEYVLGQKLLNQERTSTRPSSGLKSAHKVVAAGLGALFAVNTVTGVWNLVEARHDPSGRTRRTVHALGMLLADAGFLYTASLAESARETDAGANRHRNAAIASMSVASLSTLMMYFWKD
jgi:hypothetical protein